MNWFRKKPGKSVLRPVARWLRARFDAATTTKDSARHWAAAEFLSAGAEADGATRRTLRTRARYEVQNNSYARGIVNTIADDTVGTGPRLQMLLEDNPLCNAVERDFAAWAGRVHLARKLRTMRVARCQDGEAFAILAQNPALASPVRLDLQLIEADRVTDSDATLDDERWVDGIELDRFGNPKSYLVRRKHPGGVAHSLLSRAHREDALQVQVGVLKRTTEDEVVDLVSFVEGLAVGFLGKILGGCARCTKTEHVPLYVPEHLRERRQFTGVVELTFKEIVHDPGGRI